MKFTLLALLLLVCACTKSGKKADTISISLPGDISSIDPAICYDTVCYVPVAQVYESLFELDYLKRPYVVKPLLAQALPIVSNDRLKYTFKIKKGVKYHKSDLVPAGREVKAQDFVNGIKRLTFLGTQSKGWWLFD